MKIKIIYFITIITINLLCANILISQSNQFKSVNFQCGGYVSNVVPAYNPSGNMSTQILYARTDIGGVYKSTNNGDNWISINNYLRAGNYITTSDLSVQGIAVHPTNSDIVMIAVGNYRDEDHPLSSMFRSTNGGTNWFEVNLPSPGMIFRGNNFAIKIGGECIKFNPIDPTFIFAGGAPPQGANNNFLYYSSNSGLNWYKYDNLNLSTSDTIISIQYTSDGTELWVGTTNGLYRRTSSGWATQTNSFGGFPYSRRILLKGSGTGITAYVAYNNDPDVVTDIGLAKFTNSGGWVNLVGDYNSGFNREFVYYSTSTPNALRKTLFSTLTFANVPSLEDEQQMVEIVVAGRYGRPIRYSYNNGSYWDGNQNFVGQGYSVMLNYGSGNVYPGHQFSDEPFVYTGLNNLVQNPYNNNYWYSTGGASPFRSSNGGIFTNSTWQYKPNGMSMTVVYDVTIKPHTFDQIFFPISDWTLGYQSTTNIALNNSLRYDRSLTRSGGNTGDTYIPNVTRLLHAPTQYFEQGVSYAIGGSVYSPYPAAMYKRTQFKFNGDPTITRLANYSPFNNTDRAFVDGIISHNYDNNQSRLILLFGRSKEKEKPINTYSDLGVYYSTNSGVNFSKSNFNNFSEISNENAQDIIENSLIPRLIDDTQLGNLFSSQFNLANDPSAPEFKYLWLEGFASPKGGGFFRSADHGVNWYYINSVVGNTSYRGEGCLKASNTGKLYLTIRKTGANDGGLYTSSNKGDSWFKVTTFTSAEQVAARDNWVYVYGKKSTDSYPRLYVATDNGNNTFSSWNEVNNKITSVRAITFNPDPCRFELFISTGGLGVIRHTPNIYYSNCVADEFIIDDSLLVYDNIDFDRDVVVKENAKLTISDSCTLKFGTGKKIIIEEGGKIELLNSSVVTFSKIESSNNWGGIEFRGSAKGTINNAIFNNTETPITIVSGQSEAPSDTILIENNVFNGGSVSISDRAGVKIIDNSFNYSGGSGLVVAGISTTGSNNILIKDNEIYYAENLTPTIGINVIYGDNILIYNNNIQDCHTGISISNSSPKIFYNNINATYEASVGISLDNSLSPYLKGNSVVNYNVGISNYLSSPVMYRNNVMNESFTAQIGLKLDYNSIANLEPEKVDDTPEWVAGWNEILLPHSGYGIFVNDYSYPIMKCSFNKIYGGEYNIKGKTSVSELTINALNNNWYHNPATSSRFDIDCDIEYETYSESVPSFNNSPSIYGIGFNIQDTLLKSDESTCPSDNSGLESSIYYSASNDERQGNYTSAKQKYEQIVNNYVNGKYSKTSLKKILNCADKLNYNESEYGILRNYYLTQRNNNINDTSFANISEELAIKCLVRKDEFETAINEYENIVSGSSDSGKILNAQLNIIETYLIMSAQGDNLNSSGMTNYTGRISSLKPISLKDAIGKMNKILGRNLETDNPIEIPVNYELSQNYPNPFNPVTKINFDLPKEGLVKLKVYDLLGREIAVLVNNEFKQPGRYTVEFNGTNLASGIYFYRIETKEFIQTKKMVLVK